MPPELLSSKPSTVPPPGARFATDSAGQTDITPAGSSLGVVLSSAAATVTCAAELGLATPERVGVTAHGCVATADTELILSWRRLWDRAPSVTTFHDSAHLTVTGTISGVCWTLQNGFAAPAHGRPWSHDYGPVRFADGPDPENDVQDAAPQEPSPAVAVLTYRGEAVGTFTAVTPSPRPRHATAGEDSR